MVVVLLLLLSLAWGQSSNNFCTSPTVLSVGSPSPFTTIGNVRSGPVGTCVTSTGPDAYFTFTANLSGAYDVSLCGSSFDTYLRVTALPATPCTSGLQLGCNDDFCSTSSQVRVQLNASASVMIQVAGYVAGSGSGSIVVRFVAPTTTTTRTTTTRGNTTTVTTVSTRATTTTTVSTRTSTRTTVASTLPGTIPPGVNNNLCANAYTLTTGVKVGFDTRTATNDGGTVCGSGPDLWYRFTAPVAATYTVELCDSNYDTYLQLKTSCTGSQLGCNDDFCGTRSSLTVSLSQSQVVVIRVAGYNGQSGTGQISVQSSAVIPPSPSANSCTGSAPLSLSTVQSWSTTGTLRNLPNSSCQGPGGSTNTAWFSFQPATTQDYVVDALCSTGLRPSVPIDITIYDNTSNGDCSLNETFRVAQCQSYFAGASCGQVQQPPLLLSSSQTYFVVVTGQTADGFGSLRVVTPFQLSQPSSVPLAAIIVPVVVGTVLIALIVLLVVALALRRRRRRNPDPRVADAAAFDPNPRVVQANQAQIEMLTVPTGPEGAVLRFSAPPQDACVVCLSRWKEVLLSPCAHICMCVTDAEALRNAGERDGDGAQCPICRTPIESFRRLKVAPTDFDPQHSEEVHLLEPCDHCVRGALPEILPPNCPTCGTYITMHRRVFIA